jgi:hypothetical protein
LTSKINSSKIVCKFPFFFETVFIAFIPAIYIFLGFFLFFLSFLFPNMARSFLIVRKTRLKYKFAEILSSTINNVRMIYFAGLLSYFLRSTSLSKHYRDLIILYHRFSIFQRPIFISQAKLQFYFLYERRETRLFRYFNFMKVVSLHNSDNRRSRDLAVKH